MTIKNFLLTAMLALFVASSGCKTGKGMGLNFFSIEDDMKLGLQVSQQIEGDSKQFPILPESQNRDAYKLVRGITNKILRTGHVKYADKFAWEVKIIDDNNTLNAFATPGGYIYVYSGLIKYLDSEDQLAGVMGHEIAHSALRHSTRQMTKVYGLQVMLSIATGNAEPGLIEQLALGVVNLRFSRTHETEADKGSVKYLCGTSYDGAGAAGFFKKIQQEGGARQPEFLSTHPSPDKRVENIEKDAASRGCKGRQGSTAEYTRIKNSL